MEWKLKSGAIIRVTTEGAIHYRNEDIVYPLGRITVLGRFLPFSDREMTPEMLFAIHNIINRLHSDGASTPPTKTE
jgi:hypothetical protein